MTHAQDKDASERDSRAAELVRDAVARYEGPLTAYAAKLLGDVDRARDVVQDTFLKLWTADPATVNGHLAPWLYRVCRNRALDVSRKEDRMTTAEHEVLEARDAMRMREHSKSSDNHAAAPADSGAVMAAMACLSDKQQEVIRLKFQGGLSYQEIANVMDITANHVGVLIHTALKAVREQLGRATEAAADAGGARKFR